MWTKIIQITLFVFSLSIFFFYIPNKSNFPKKYMIPIMVSLIIKYIMGDLDKGYTYTVKDIYYWSIILFIPYMVVLYLEKNKITT